MPGPPLFRVLSPPPPPPPHSPKSPIPAPPPAIRPGLQIAGIFPIPIGPGSGDYSGIGPDSRFGRGIGIPDFARVPIGIARESGMPPSGPRLRWVSRQKRKQNASCIRQDHADRCRCFRTRDCVSVRAAASEACARGRVSPHASSHERPRTVLLPSNTSLGGGTPPLHTRTRTILYVLAALQLPRERPFRKGRHHGNLVMTGLWSRTWRGHLLARSTPRRFHRIRSR